MIPDDPSWREAIEAIDRGDVAGLRALIAARPALATERAEGGEGYFARPYLVWFVAENPVRNDRLPEEIVEIARVLVDAAPKGEALDGALGLVASGRVAREAGVQEGLIEVLAEAGAAVDGAMRGALAHGEVAAAQALLAKGAQETLVVASSLGHVDRIAKLVGEADEEERAAAIVCAAVNGQADAIAALVAAGVDVNVYGPAGCHAHATALHQAIAAGSRACVEALLAGGADREQRDRIHDGTALGWAEHLGREEIAARLRAG